MTDPSPSQRDARESAAESTVSRVRALVDAHYDFVWRYLRRLGLSDDAADDAGQQVFIIAARKIGEIAQGSERSFLIGTAMRVASEARRTTSRRREVGSDDAREPADPAPHADELLDRQRARAMLDDALASMPLEMRTVFVLFEIEEMTMAEIATLLELPPGTVASRLRRAREDYETSVKRLRARGFKAGGP